jgi:hypothetical protein
LKQSDRNGALDVSMKDVSEFETSMAPKKPGRYQIFVNGFKDPFIANVTVTQTPVSSVINEAGIKRFYGDRMIMVPVSFADEQGNAPESQMEFRFTVTPSENGRVAVQGVGLNTRVAPAEGGKA